MTNIEKQLKELNKNYLEKSIIDEAETDLDKMVLLGTKIINELGTSLNRLNAVVDDSQEYKKTMLANKELYIQIDYDCEKLILIYAEYLEKGFYTLEESQFLANIDEDAIIAAQDFVQYCLELILQYEETGEWPVEMDY